MATAAFAAAGHSGLFSHGQNIIPVVAGGGYDSIAIGRDAMWQCSAGGSDRKKGTVMEVNDKSQNLK